MNRYRVIDPEGKQPVCVVEVVGPPSEDLAKGIAAHAILGGAIPANALALEEVTSRLVVKQIDDKLLRCVLTELHACFEGIDGFAYEGYEIQVADFRPDGIVVAFHRICPTTGRARPLADESVVISVRSFQSIFSAY